MFDFDAFLASLAANLVILSPVEVAVIVLVVRIYREVGKLAATYEMLPDLSQAERRFVRWWMATQLRAEMKLKLDLSEPGKPAPWEV